MRRYFQCLFISQIWIYVGMIRPFPPLPIHLRLGKAHCTAALFWENLPSPINLSIFFGREFPGDSWHVCQKKATNFGEATFLVSRCVFRLLGGGDALDVGSDLKGLWFEVGISKIQKHTSLEDISGDGHKVVFLPHVLHENTRFVIVIGILLPAKPT